jgi:diadenosine tetraphosphatase ApaH/serine/threonine PP2A family protein phosphatase
MNNERIIAIGDVHGCFDELMELLEKVGFYSGQIDKILFVGDLIDKGPKSKEVIEWVKTWSSCCSVILGNHEEKHIRYQMHEKRKIKNKNYQNPMIVHDDFLKTRQELLKITLFDPFKFMETWNTYYYVLDAQNHLVVHGGVFPEIKAEHMHPKVITRLRYLKSDTEMASLDEIEPHMPYWTEKYKGPEKIIFGHQPFHTPYIASHAIGVDTGCVHGNKLTAYCLWDGSFVSVDARDSYFKLMPTSPGSLNEKW